MAEGRLKEVEEDAVYITEKRFADQREQHQRELAKQEREEAKANTANQTEPNSGKDKK